MKNRKINAMRLLPALLLLTAVGCNSSDNNHNHDMAAVLFDKSLALLNTYIDSLKVAKDSIETETLMIHYDVKAASLNFEFPANTDLNLTQEENDSLIHMTDSMVRTRNRREYFFAHRNDSTSTNPRDSIDSKGSIDSISYTRLRMAPNIITAR